MARQPWGASPLLHGFLENLDDAVSWQQALSPQCRLAAVLWDEDHGGQALDLRRIKAGAMAAGACMVKEVCLREYVRSKDALARRSTGMPLSLIPRVTWANTPAQRTARVDWRQSE